MGEQKKWIQLDEDTYAKQPEKDPEEIVKISEIDEEITNLQNQIDDIVKLEYPTGASKEIKEAVDDYNTKKEEEKNSFQMQKEALEAKKAEI